ncbi:RAD55 family ATPase [Palaeococcus pacificus]|uniref:RAD55 family ATPase n=1 Tax=Palaeococcus pacificus TaxID=971279 RepID=UPI00373AF26D
MTLFPDDILQDRIEKDITRVSTGIIDELITGGIPKGSVILLIGDPKAGKTTFISQFMYNQVIYGAPVIGILTDVSKYEFLSNSLDFGWDFTPYVDDRLFIIDAYSSRIGGKPKFAFEEATITNVADMGQVISVIKDITLRIVQNANPSFITGVISSLTPLFFESEVKDIYKFLEDLKDLAHRHKQVWILEMNSGIEAPHVETMVKAIVDGIIELKLMEEDKTLRRYMRVYGMKRTRHVLSWVPYEITSTGIQIKL